MKNKSIYDLAMELKSEKSNDNNIIVTKKYSRLSSIGAVLSIIFKVIFYILICLILTIGMTVIANKELREQVTNVIQINV